ncbi:MAG TPA: prepilin-type cleavage/methylation domain-containing protein, partial [Aquifex sp.]|nr:prepilin-type cleavage/methylation domain-containing protein [Aquifex sp.]
LIVIAIIAILASMAIPFYQRYQAKAKITSYALPHAQDCMQAAAAFCIEHPGATYKELTGNLTSEACANFTAPDGLDVNATFGNNFECTNNGTLADGASVTYSYDSVGNATCSYNASSGQIACSIELP